MTLEARLFVAGLGLALLSVIVRALRTHRLRYEYSVLWLLLGGGLIVLSAFQPTADRIARWVGIDYPPTFYLLLCLFVVLLVLFHLSLRLSVLGDQLKDLAQQVALFTADSEPARAGTTVPLESGSARAHSMDSVAERTRSADSVTERTHQPDDRSRNREIAQAERRDREQS